MLIVLDNPGAREDKEGEEYVCGTRQTLPEAIFEANLKADDIYITYLLKCSRYESMIKKEQEDDTVVQTMLGDTDAHVKDLRGSWHMVLGYRTIVSYHPLAVRRRPNLAKYFARDFEMLAQS